LPLIILKKHIPEYLLRCWSFLKAFYLNFMFFFCLLLSLFPHCCFYESQKREKAEKLKGRERESERETTEILDSGRQNEWNSLHLLLMNFAHTLICTHLKAHTLTHTHALRNDSLT